MARSDMEAACSRGDECTYRITVGTAPLHNPVTPSFRITSLVTVEILRLESAPRPHNSGDPGHGGCAETSRLPLNPYTALIALLQPRLDEIKRLQHDCRGEA